jgi:nucleoside-diphosphate-sugar epimerase
MTSNYGDGVHVVFGATGAYGYAVTRKLAEKNLHVRAVVRDEKKASKLLPKNIEIVKADLFTQEDVLKSSRDAAFIYIANNFPYHDWIKKYPILVENILRGARVAHSVVVFPGNVYGYGEFQHFPVDETHPLNANGRKGKIRNKLETLLMEYHNKGDIKVVIPRFADFYGPNVTNDLYGAMFRNSIEGKTVVWPLNLDVTHNFTYIDDAAEGTLILVNDPKSYGKVYHITGPPTTARQFINEIFRVSNSNSRIKVISKNLLRLTSLFNSNVRELIELLYEYDKPYYISDKKFTEEYPKFNHTPYESGILTTVRWFREHSSA